MLILNARGLPPHTHLQCRRTDVGDDDTMLGTRHPVGVGFQLDHGGAPVQTSPPARLAATVVASAPPLTPRASPPLPCPGLDPQDQVPLAVLAGALLTGRLHYRVLDPEKVTQ
jgi:hypothetical protein